ncbi:MAG: methionyl-tRNA formyltransferase [Bacteroidota bacterium]|nr:methionyl-tRNA formyltransferase [Bacteroidota bacterium]GIR57925.1 MAG: methionyl-tRNA formyltransferase [Crocinitomicaceae bacterium]
MKVVFFGTPDFAVASLKAINECMDHSIVGVVTSVDKPAGRGKKLRSSAVKNYAAEHKLHLLQPENLKSNEFTSQLHDLSADIFVVVAFRMMPKSIWSIPKHGTFNLHASLLPQYRGAAPINWAIINDEKETGVTTFLIDEKIDTGNILLSQKINIEKEDNAGSLYDKLMTIGKELVIETLNCIESGVIKPIKQHVKDLELKTAPKLNKENTRINWKKEAKEINSLIKGLSPYPSAWCQIKLNDRLLNFKIFRAEIGEDLNLGAGEVLMGKNELTVGTASGTLKLLDIQLEGKRRAAIADFVNGHKQFNEIILI